MPCGSQKTVSVFTRHLLLWSLLLCTLVMVLSVLFHISPGTNLNPSTRFYEKSVHMEHFVRLIDLLKNIEVMGNSHIMESSPFFLSPFVPNLPNISPYYEQLSAYLQTYQTQLQSLSRITQTVLLIHQFYEDSWKFIFVTDLILSLFYISAHPLGFMEKGYL